MGHSVAETQEELCDLVVEELLEDAIVEETVEHAIDAFVCDITTEEKNKRNQEKAAAAAATAAAAEAEEATSLRRKEAAARQRKDWIKLPDIVAQTSKFTCSAAKYVDNVEHIRQELEKLRAQRDEIVNGIEMLSQQMTCAKERVDAAKEDLREGERDLDRARLDVFLQLQHFGEDCVYIDSDPRKPLPHQAALASVAEDEEEDAQGQHEARAEQQAHALIHRSFAAVDGFAPAAAAAAVLGEVLSLRQRKMMRPGLVGGGRGDEEKSRNEAMRGDLLVFYSNSTISYYADFKKDGQGLQLLEELGSGGGGNADVKESEEGGSEGMRVELPAVDRMVERMDVAVAMAARQIPELRDRRALLVRSKVMLTCYPGQGSAYVRHVDNPNRNGRVLTAILYLNPDYNPATDGGQIRLFVREGGAVEGKEEAFDVEPLLNRLLLFWSDKRVPHEVLPSSRERYAVTVWYSDAESMSGMVR